MVCQTKPTVKKKKWQNTPPPPADKRLQLRLNLDFIPLVFQTAASLGFPFWVGGAPRCRFPASVFSPPSTWLLCLQGGGGGGRCVTVAFHRLTLVSERTAVPVCCLHLGWRRLLGNQSSSCCAPPPPSCWPELGCFDRFLRWTCCYERGRLIFISNQVCASARFLAFSELIVCLSGWVGVGVGGVETEALQTKGGRENSQEKRVSKGKGAAGGRGGAWRMAIEFSTIVSPSVSGV